MPFTFSHPAIILPFAKYSGKYISLTGLIIGSVTPDFEYFFRMKVQSNISHTISGLFYFDLPVGILLSFVFHMLIRNSLYNNLPKVFKSRLEVFKSFKWNNYFKTHYFVVIFSLLIGAASHLFWDSFTHLHGYAIQNISSLQSSFNIAGYEIAIYKLLQHLSSLVGGLFIALAFFRLPKTDLAKQGISIDYWLTILTIITVIVALSLIFSVEKNLIGQFVVTGITAVFIALVFAPFFNRNKI